MNLREIADEIASQADDFLAGATNRTEARAGVNELIHSEYPNLSALDKTTVAEEVMRILEEEEFFSGNGLGDTFIDGESTADPDSDVDPDTGRDEVQSDI